MTNSAFINTGAHLGLNLSRPSQEGSSTQRSTHSRDHTPSFQPEQDIYATNAGYRSRHRSGTEDEGDSAATERMQNLQDENTRLREELAAARREAAMRNPAHTGVQGTNGGNGQGRQVPGQQGLSDEEHEQRLFLDDEAAERARLERAASLIGRKEKDPKKVVLPDVVRGFKENALGMSKSCFYCVHSARASHFAGGACSLTVVWLPVGAVADILPRDRRW